MYHPHTRGAWYANHFEQLRSPAIALSAVSKTPEPPSPVTRAMQDDPTKDRAAQQCPICLHTGSPVETRRVRCNVRRFRDRHFTVWRCGQCQSLHSEKVENIDKYYDDYPIRNQQLDYFVRAWYRVVLRRLVQSGLTRDSYILDYGCNQGLLILFLKQHGFSNCFGYDPYIEQYKSRNVLEAKYDFVISLDVIEHDNAPLDLLTELTKLLKPGGRLCLETPNADGIDLTDQEVFLHALHVPYHVHIFSQRALADVATRRGLKPVAAYNRWYMDSWIPGTSRRLFESLMEFGGNDLDLGYEPPRIDVFIRHPVLFFYLFFGYFIPPHKKDHLMMIFAGKC